MLGNNEGLAPDIGDLLIELFNNIENAIQTDNWSSFIALASELKFNRNNFDEWLSSNCQEDETTLTTALLLIAAMHSQSHYLAYLLHETKLTLSYSALMAVLAHAVKHNNLEHITLLEQHDAKVIIQQNLDPLWALMTHEECHHPERINSSCYQKLMPWLSLTERADNFDVSKDTKIFLDNIEKVITQEHLCEALEALNTIAQQLCSLDIKPLNHHIKMLRHYLEKWLQAPFEIDQLIELKIKLHSYALMATSKEFDLDEQQLSTIELFHQKILSLRKNISAILNNGFDAISGEFETNLAQQDTQEYVAQYGTYLQKFTAMDFRNKGQTQHLDAKGSKKQKIT